MNFNNFTIKSQEAIQQAIELVQSKGQQVVETPHLMKGIMLKGEDKDKEENPDAPNTKKTTE